jgi:hypothetical protein
MNSKPASIALLALLVSALGTPSTFAENSVSPDKQWEYVCVDDDLPRIVKAGTTQVVVDLAEDQSVPHPNDAEVVWSPDSKRFSFNYSPPHASHTSYVTIALFQLRGDKWEPLPSPVDENAERTQLVQLAKEHFPKSAIPRHAEPQRDILKVRNWADANTAILYAYAAWTGSGSRNSRAAFLFTLKFDADGKSKIVKTQRVPDKDIED